MSDDNVVSIKDFFNHETRISLVEKAITNIDGELKEIKDEMRSYFKWTIGGIFGTYALIITLLITVIAKVSH